MREFIPRPCNSSGQSIDGYDVLVLPHCYAAAYSARLQSGTKTDKGVESALDHQWAFKKDLNRSLQIHFSTINDKFCSGYKTGVITSQKQNGFSYFFRTPHALHGYLFDVVLRNTWWYSLMTP